MNEILAKFKRYNEEQQIVYAVAYPANYVDVYGDFTTEEELKKTAYKFIGNGFTKNIDTMHDEKPNGSYVVESFFAKADDQDYPEGSWVVGIKIPDTDLWGKVKSGKINGLSISILTKAEPVVAEVETDAIDFNETYPAEDGHTHLFYMSYDDNGSVKEGRTSVDDRHSHLIRRGTATEISRGHAHRIDGR